MVTKLILRPHSLSSAILSHHIVFTKPSLPKFHIISLFSTTNPISQTLIQSFSYGPSLHKGINPAQKHQFQSSILAPNQHKQESEDEEEESVNLNEDSFIRVFEISAIRVPSKDCFALENRLRGHLLNWPRIRNIARVPGDDVDEEFLNLLGKNQSNFDDEEENNLVSLNRRVYGKAEGDGEELSPVLYRDKLVNEFNSRGFVNFKNLAKMSRPKKKKERNGDEYVNKGKKGIGKNDFAMVKVVEDGLEGEDLSGLLGDDFKGRKWRGSTRLLLLDERYASNCVEELPEAIKVAVSSL